MTEERLGAIEETLVSHTAKFETLEIGQEEMRTHLMIVDRRLNRIDRRLDGIDSRLDGIDSRLDRIDGRLDRLEVGHEQLIEQVKQIAEGHAATQAAVARSTETIIGYIDQRISPLEQAVRAHFGAG
jgi:chromosome segregation ATPase